jgi:low affinity Fe/Cu permease
MELTMETFNFILAWVCVLLSLAFLAMCIFTMEWQLILCGMAVTAVMVFALHHELSK